MRDLCKCGDLKECHLPHELDKNGGKCSHCDCKVFTWVGFLYTDKELNDGKIAKNE